MCSTPKYPSHIHYIFQSALFTFQFKLYWKCENESTREITNKFPKIMKIKMCVCVLRTLHINVPLGLLVSSVKILANLHDDNTFIANYL